MSFSRAEGRLLAAYYERFIFPRLKFLLVQPLCMQASPGLLHTILWELGLRKPEQDNDDPLSTDSAMRKKLFFI